MRFFPATLVLALTATSLTASAQAYLAGGAAPVSGAVARAGSPGKEGGAAPAAPTAVVVHGRVHCPEGPLPGAVIHLNGTKVYAVTDSQGAFELTAPAGMSPLEITCSYAGFRDVVQRVGKSNTVEVELKTQTKLPPRDRSAETSWW